jgi:hypothetical protein
MFDTNNVSLKNLFIGATVVGAGSCIGWNGTKLVSMVAAGIAVGAKDAIKNFFAKEEAPKVEAPKAA